MIGKFKLNTAHLGDWVENTKKLPDQSINCVLTSPPYYGLRDYGTAEWVGGNPDCKHIDPYQTRGQSSKKQSTNNQGHGGSLWKKCKFCGAERKDKQLGLEDTSEEFITNLCNGFEEIKRALRDDGTCWVNIGDTYNKEKSLYGTPFSFALEMVKRGWLLRNTIIWHKESVMPTSVKDRFTCDFEYMFFFTKSKEYWFEQQFEKCSTIGKEQEDRNMRATWTINPASFKDSHFATFPKKLCMTPIKSGCPPKGIVLDPFLGSGTTGIVASELGRNWLGFELNPEYLEMAKQRTSQRGMFV